MQVTDCVKKLCAASSKLALRTRIHLLCRHAFLQYVPKPEVLERKLSLHDGERKKMMALTVAVVAGMPMSSAHRLP